MDSVAQVLMQWTHPFSERLVVYLRPADNERGPVGSYPGGGTLDQQDLYHRLHQPRRIIRMPLHDRLCKNRAGVWRILWIAQIEHKRISVYAQSAHPQRTPERIAPCSSSLDSMRPNCWPFCVACTCVCTRHNGRMCYASPMRWWSPKPGITPSRVGIALVSRLPTPRTGRTRCG